MNIAFIHFHFNSGGVSKVISQQIEFCQEKGWPYILIGAENGASLPHFKPLKSLHYDHYLQEKKSLKEGSESLAKSIKTILKNSFKGPCDILHIHNGTLGKNKALLGALNILDQEGYPLFIQIHDLAEEGRPSLYSAEPYPFRAYYGVINRRDYHFLNSAGLKEENLIYLPNRVSPLPLNQNPLKSKQKRALYAVRGIKRKNLGEMLLLSALYKQINFGLTMAPENEKEKPIYNLWTSLAKELNLNIEFNLKNRFSFEENLQGSSLFISTSVQEGFGFSYLEPWTINRAIGGRKIPSLFSDFEEAGMNMDHFYKELLIPKTLIDFPLFKTKWFKQMEKEFYKYTTPLEKTNMAFSPSEKEEFFNRLKENFILLFEEPSAIDFAKLDLKNRVQIIKRIANEPLLKEEILSLNSSLIFFDSSHLSLNNSQRDKTINSNKNIVLTQFGQDKYQKRLEALYKKIEKKTKGSFSIIDKKKLLLSYLNPRFFYLLLGESINDQ